MIPKPEFSDAVSICAAPKADGAAMAKLIGAATELGFEVVDIAGFFDLIDKHSSEQVTSLVTVREGASQVMEANGAVRDAASSVAENTDTTLDAVENSVAFVRRAGQRSHEVASWVAALSQRTRAVSETLEAVERNTVEIAKISAQVNMLAINAKVEAARAGSAGRGFAVVAEAIGELSGKTDKAAEGITGNISKLADWIKTLSQESHRITEEANAVIEESKGTDEALSSIDEGVRSIHTEAQRISCEVDTVQQAAEDFATAFGDIGSSVQEIAGEISKTRDRVHGFIDRSEAIVQIAISMGGSREDGPFIDRVTADAAEISNLFAEALRVGRISDIELFSQEYRPIQGSNPEQVMAPFTGFTDQVLPPIQEAALDFDPKVIFCAAVDTNGYLPTHNLKFSKPQGDDPDWNESNSRNRRIFDDRVGLKAGRSTEPYLLQVYRRKMGNGEYVMMKDLSAPIMVNGRHWGGLRLAYKF